MPDYPKQATPAQVWSEPTRTLSALTGQPRTDLLGEDATFEAGVGTRKAKIDNVDAAVSTRALESGGRLSSVPAFVAPTESSVVMDGTEKILFELTDVKSSEVEAWVDLTPMVGGDTIVIRYSRKLKAAGSLDEGLLDQYSFIFTAAQKSRHAFADPQSFRCAEILGQGAR